jgi:hypothetical protein
MAKIAAEKLAANPNDRAEFYGAKLKTARFFMERMLPEVESRFRMVMAGAKPLMDMSESEFAA